jgi:glutathione S-transferase
MTITLYASVASRSLSAFWMLEELGLAYAVHDVDLRKRANDAPEYRRLNPIGKVPALVDGKVEVAEAPAICLYLADRYGYGALAPKIDDSARGRYLQWMVFSTAVFEPTIFVSEVKQPERSWGPGWGKREDVFDAVERAVANGPWLMGTHFTAADVMLGSLVQIGLFNNLVPRAPALLAYDARLEARPARKRAGDLTWPPQMFGHVQPA